MRNCQILLFVVMTTAIAGCGGSSPTPASPSPVVSGNFSQPPAAPGPCVVGFDELRANGAAFTTHAACGLSITTTAASWQASTTYGRPAPFVQFLSPGGTTTTGEMVVAAAGGAFAFVSVDIYSSTTKIPYEITGLVNGAVAFTVAGVQGNTFGDFATIANPRAPVLIDLLRIRLTNPAAPCCRNPVGLDNVRVIR